jgi:hypothetical protein
MILTPTAASRWSFSQSRRDSNTRTRFADLFLKDLIMQTPHLECQTPSLAAWSRTARPVSLAMLFDRNSSVRHGADHDDASAGLDDVLFGCSSATLLFMFAVAAFVA